MSETPKDQDKLSEAEAAKRRDAVLKKMLGTPPKPRRKKEGTNKGAARPTRV